MAVMKECSYYELGHNGLSLRARMGEVPTVSDGTCSKKDCDWAKEGAKEQCLKCFLVA